MLIVRTGTLEARFQDWLLGSFFSHVLLTRKMKIIVLHVHRVILFFHFLQGKETFLTNAILITFEETQLFP